MYRPFVDLVPDSEVHHPYNVVISRIYLNNFSQGPCEMLQYVIFNKNYVIYPNISFFSDAISPLIVDP